MDAFTENILARARERQRLLEDYNGVERTPLRDTNVPVTEARKIRKESLSDSNIHSLSTNIESQLKENKSESNLSRFTKQNSRTRVSSEMPASPKSQMKTLNIQQDNFNMEIKVTSTENVRVEVEIAETDDDNDDNQTASDTGMRIESKSKLKRLGQLYGGGDEVNISSPIHRTEAKFCANESIVDDCDRQDNIPKTPRKGLSKLAHLAETINQWEDDLHHVPIEKKNSPKKTWKPQAPQPPSLPSNKNSPVKSSGKPKAPEPPVLKEISSPKNVTHSSTSIQECIPKKDTIQVVGVIAKNVNWDKNVLDKLESQGFTRTNSKSRIVYSYNNSQDKNTDTKAQEKDKQLKTVQEELPKENKIKQLTNALEARIEAEAEKPVSPTKTKQIGFVKQPTSPVKQPLSPMRHPTSPTKTVHSRLNNIAEIAAVFENSPTKSNKDPALLSVSERKALFEKNKGDALVPKAAFGMAPALKMETVMKASSTKILNPDPTLKSSNFVNKEKVVVQIEPVRSRVQSPPRSSKKPPAPKPPVERDSPTVAAVQQAGGIASKMAALLENKSTISQYQIESSTKSERQKEMDMLLNRFNRNKDVANDVIEEASDEDDETDTTEESAMINSKHAKIVMTDKDRRRSGEKRKSGGKPYSKGDSPIVAAVLDDVKRIKVTGPKEGRLYPNLSDIEATTETETRTPSPDEDNNSSFDSSIDSDDPNTSFGRDILQAVCKNQTPQKRPIYDESTASDISSILDDMDNYLDELSNEDNASVGPTPPKQVRQVTPQKSAAQASNSFHYKNYSPRVETPKKPMDSPDKSLPEFIVEGDTILPLTHTVSFYRKQQNLAQSPSRQISRQPILEEAPLENTDESLLVNGKIKELQDEVHRQQNIISQTSQALNLCSCTPEFSGSTEQVEAERVLLVATHRRQSALHEIQRLKVEGTIRPQGQHAKNVPLEKGTLTISKIVLPLKSKYVKALAAAGGKGHHIVCLIKCGEQVVPAKLTSTVIHSAKNPDTDLIIPGSVVLHNIYSDFTITFEVYCLQAQEEFLPHEVKYHINNKKSGNKLVTPKKSKQDSRMVMPIKESPAGPQAVRTSSFALMGYAVFSVQAVNKRIWNLNNTPAMSPLEGTVEMKICCELAVSVEHRGFLTMFEDVSGFGAWHRRWCLLKGHTVSYWKYPDDERKMAPINSIDLKNCITDEVKPVNREICARQHTFLLEMERHAYSTDKDSLITICKGDKTIIRHLLSADTKPERVQWCTKFNAALTALRMWGNTQQ